MAIQIDTPTVHRSIAQALRGVTPEATIYDNPNQQATRLPAWFIVHREPVRIEREISRWVLVYALDLVYMLDFNITGLYDKYSAIADALDLALVYLEIYGSGGAKTHVYERNWQLDMSGLKYSIELRFRVAPNTKLEEYMQVIEDLQVFLKDSGMLPKDMAKIEYINIEHPEFAVTLPKTSKHEKGSKITLPYVFGKFPREEKTWFPKRWDIGDFGSEYTLVKDTIAELEWEFTVGVDYPQGQFISGEMQYSDKYVVLDCVETVEIDHGEIMTLSGYDIYCSSFDFVPDEGLDLTLSCSSQPMSVYDASEV